MNPAKLVSDYLADQSAITDLVPAKYIAWGETAKFTAATWIRVTEIYGNRIYNLDFAAPEVQVSVFTKDKDDLEDIKEAVISELRNVQATMSAVTVVSVLTDDRGPFQDNTYWHAPVSFGLRLQSS